MSAKKELTEYERAVSALKHRFKQAGISYRDLAAELGMSESGVKKFLGARDGSFGRLAECCEILGINLAELLTGLGEEVVAVTFTPAQEKLLNGDAAALAMFWRLVYERRTVEEASALGSLSEKQRFKVLRLLDGVDLIKLLPGERVRVPAVQPITWHGGGALAKRLYKEWGHRLIDATATPDGIEGGQFLIRYFQMAPRTYAEFLEAQRALEQEFLRRSVQDMRKGLRSPVHVRWLTATDDRSFLS